MKAENPRLREDVEVLETSRALDELLALIKARAVCFEGKDELIQQSIKAGLERGLQAELTEHLGYARATRRRRSIRTHATAPQRRPSRPVSGMSSSRSHVIVMARSLRRLSLRDQGVWAGSMT